jgi:hypothetical protein
MAILTRRLGAAALGAVAAGLLAVTPAPAVGPNNPVRPYFPGTPPVNPNWWIAPGLTVRQAAFNVRTLGRAYQNVPPWVYGYNPYPQAVNLGPSFPSLYGGYGVPPYAASLTSTSPYGPGAYNSLYASPGGAYAGYGGGGYGGGYGDGGYNPYYSYPDPYGGGLRGAADAIRAQGQFEMDFQHARLLNQEVERSKVDTRRKIYDEWLYERANTPNIVDIQAKTQALENRRALLGMPLTEIVNAYALNTLLEDLIKKGNFSARDPYGPIDPDTLKQINLTSRSSAGNVGLLKSVKEGAPLGWPHELQASAYQEEVRRLNQRASEAIKLVQNQGQVEPSTINDMKEDIRRLRAKVSSHINDLTPSQSIRANRFLDQLDDAVTALSQPDVVNYFPEKWATKARTVPDLVKYMAEKGLRFAPAVGGDEAAYTALYNYLVGYANATNQSANGGEQR